MDKPVCLIDTASDGKLCVQQSALQVLEQIQQPVVVVAVVGLYRTGKSYLMNRLAGKQTGFALGSTIESKTKGIWMWCVPHPTKPGTTLVLLDTEGLGDVDKGDSVHDTRIFSLAVLLSSTLVLNSRGTIDNRAIEELQYPSDQQVCNSIQVNNYNLPRECIRKYFPSRKCFTFPFPTNPDNVSYLETLDPAEISKRFLEVTDRFCQFIFDQSQVKNLKDGHTVTGRVLGHLVKTYVDTIASGAVPCLENAVISMALIENEAAFQEGLEVYQSGMEKLKKSFPLELNEITSEHQCFSLMATQTFMKRCFRDSDGKFLTSLEIAEVLEKFLQQKVAVTTAILQADDKLTENERKICEERERAVLLEQEIKAQEERQRQLKEKMVIEEQNNEERVRQVIQKMEEEMSFQQQETQRAMDSKLREQAALMEKGFQEKANKMASEIEELRRNNKEVEDRKSREFAQMIADQERRNAENMEVLRQQHRQQMEAINSRPRPSSGGCSIQ
ncbi:hypothetical protein cypCar_00044638 [Cyprinus carpio]|nr:hypothetical protein cypCar_00044638 [Cyprinus carpio]